MGTFGILPTFDDQNDSWIKYAPRLDAYFIANEITEEKRMAGILRTALSASTHDMLVELYHPQDISTKSYEELKESLEKHYNPKPSRIIERFHFNSRVRQQGETVLVYIAELRKLSKNCEFKGELLDELILDRLVCGINHEGMQQRLFAEEETKDKKLTLDSATKTLLAMENATKNTQILQKQNNGKSENSTEVHHIRNNQKKKAKKPHQRVVKRDTTGDINHNTTEPRPRGKFVHGRFKVDQNACIRCAGIGHKGADCPHSKATCARCKKTGHIARGCLVKNSDLKPCDTERTNHITSNEYECPVYHIMDGILQSPESINLIGEGERDESAPPPQFVTLKINGVPVTFEVDTGCGHTLIQSQEYQRIKAGGTLKSSAITLESYSGNNVKILGSQTVHVEYHSKQASLPILVVDTLRPNLCGRKWIYSTLRILPTVNHISTAVSNRSKPRGQTTLEEILEKNKTVFTPGVGKLKGIQAHLHVKPNAIPIFCKARTIPYTRKDAMENEIRCMQKEGILEEIHYSEWASPIVPVGKPDGSIRICGDFKSTLNPQLHVDKWPLPRAEDFFAKLAGCRYFSKFDLREAYHQVELDEESRQYLVINTTIGLYRLTRLTQGVASSAAIFQRVMETILRELKQVLPFQDDILLGGKTKEDQMQQLSDTLTLFKKYNLKLRKEKCKFSESRVDFLGHTLDQNGVHPQASKMEAIMNAPTPQNLETLRSFLGLLNYYARFLPNNANTLAPLYNLLQKTSKWEWGKDPDIAFQEAKNTLKKSNMLVHYDVSKQVILACDASPVGVGAVISHEIDGKERPIAFASRSLSKAERNYSQLDREALSIIFGVKKFRDYLYGKTFVLLTDHQPLVTLLAANKPIPQLAAARLQRWALLLAAYSYEIRFKKGATHQNADALSRSPIPLLCGETPVPAEYVFSIKENTAGLLTVTDLDKLTREDEELTEAHQHMKNGWIHSPIAESMLPYHRRRTELSRPNFNNILLFGNRVIIPRIQRKTMLLELHSSHRGVKMKATARSRMWWPNIDHDIENIIKTCKSCQQESAMPPSEYTTWDKTNSPWERAHADFAGPLEGRFLFILSDSFSKWLEVEVTRNTSTEAVTSILTKHMARFGIIQTLVTDNGTCFTSREFKNYTALNGVKHVLTAPYHPASNGLAERNVRTIKTSLRKVSGGTNEAIAIIDSGLETFKTGSLEIRLARILANHRRTPATGSKSPFELMYGGREMITRLDICNPLKMGPREKGAHRPERSKYNIHQKVYAKNFGKGAKWLEGVITAHIGKIMYFIQTEIGNIKRHQNQLRTRRDPEKDSDQLDQQKNPGKETDDNNRSIENLPWPRSPIPTNPPEYSLLENQNSVSNEIPTSRGNSDSKTQLEEQRQRTPPELTTPSPNQQTRLVRSSEHRGTPTSSNLSTIQQRLDFIPVLNPQSDNETVSQPVPTEARKLPNRIRKPPKKLNL